MGFEWMQAALSACRNAVAKQRPIKAYRAAVAAGSPTDVATAMGMLTDEQRAFMFLLEGRAVGIP